MFWKLFSSSKKIRPEVTLRKIDNSNWSECVALSLGHRQQTWLPSNAYSLAQAAYEPECVPLGIYSDSIMVGFAMYATTEYNPGETVQWIYRFMIDVKNQEKGFGKEAVIQLLKYIKDRHSEQIILSYVLENKIAKNLYAASGFHETGEMYGDEIVARLS